MGRIDAADLELAIVAGAVKVQPEHGLVEQTRRDHALEDGRDPVDGDALEGHPEDAVELADEESLRQGKERCGKEIRNSRQRAAVSTNVRFVSSESKKGKGSNTHQAKARRIVHGRKLRLHADASNVHDVVLEPAAHGTGGVIDVENCPVRHVGAALGAVVARVEAAGEGAVRVGYPEVRGSCARRGWG